MLVSTHETHACAGHTTHDTDFQPKKLQVLMQNLWHGFVEIHVIEKVVTS